MDICGPVSVSSNMFHNAIIGHNTRCVSLYLLAGNPSRDMMCMKLASEHSTKAIVKLLLSDGHTDVSCGDNKPLLHLISRGWEQMALNLMHHPRFVQYTPSYINSLDTYRFYKMLSLTIKRSMHLVTKRLLMMDIYTTDHILAYACRDSDWKMIMLLLPEMKRSDIDPYLWWVLIDVLWTKFRYVTTLPRELTLKILLSI